MYSNLWNKTSYRKERKYAWSGCSVCVPTVSTVSARAISICMFLLLCLIWLFAFFLIWFLRYRTQRLLVRKGRGAEWTVVRCQQSILNSLRQYVFFFLLVVEGRERSHCTSLLLSMSSYRCVLAGWCTWQEAAIASRRNRTTEEDAKSARGGTPSSLSNTSRIPLVKPRAMIMGRSRTQVTAMLGNVPLLWRAMLFDRFVHFREAFPHRSFFLLLLYHFIHWSTIVSGNVKHRGLKDVI